MENLLIHLNEIIILYLLEKPYVIVGDDSKFQPIWQAQTEIEDAFINLWLLFMFTVIIS